MMAEPRTWDGIRDDLSETGGSDLGSASRGVSFYVTGELRRRPGLSYLAAHGGTALGTFSSPVAGSWLLVFKANGDLESVAL